MAVKKKKAVRSKWTSVECPTHGRLHTLSSGLCSHPDCVKKIIWDFSKSWYTIDKPWRRLVELGVDTDFAIWVISELLREEKEKDKPPVLNPIWLRFRVKNFLTSRLHTTGLPNQAIPDGLKRKKDRKRTSLDQLKENHGDFWENMIDNATNRSWVVPTAEKDYEYKELLHAAMKKLGEPAILYLTDEISRSEAIKLSGMKVSTFLRYLKVCRVVLKDFYKHGEWPENTERLLSEFR